MTNMIRVVNGIESWPYNLSSLRLDEPAQSFSVSPSEAELSYYGVFNILPTQPPYFDPSQVKLIEVKPIQVEGVWIQQWGLQDLTEEEKEDYNSKMYPPNWFEFVNSIPELEINSLLNSLLQASPKSAMALSVGLGKAADGDFMVFLYEWRKAVDSGLVSSNLLNSIKELAVINNLPKPFIQGLDIEMS